jgi:hypothetical protein
MIDAHLHIWDAYWADEAKKSRETDSTIVDINTEASMACKKKKGGKKK